MIESHIPIHDIVSFLSGNFGLWIGIISIIAGIYAFYLGKENNVYGLKTLAIIAIIIGLLYLSMHFLGLSQKTCDNSHGCYKIIN